MGDTIPFPTDEAIKLAVSCVDAVERHASENRQRCHDDTAVRAGNMILEARTAEKEYIEASPGDLATVAADAKRSDETRELISKARERLIGNGHWGPRSEVL